MHATRNLLLIIVCCLQACGPPVKAPVSSRGDDGTGRVADAPSRVTMPSRTDRDAGSGYHVVRKGDTLYAIAWRYGFDFRELATWNRISAPYTIYPGQMLRLQPGTAAGPAPRAATTPPSTPASPARGTIARTQPERPAAGTAADAGDASAGTIAWRWPTEGKLVKLDNLTLKNGANITGTLGQPITAAAAGEVVYSGSGLLGYGKLIIIKHSERYLSAYAHNRDILIKEGSKVSTGQKIATMGEVSDGLPILHFEIRKDGKPVDPLLHLPKQDS